MAGVWFWLAPLLATAAVGVAAAVRSLLAAPCAVNAVLAVAVSTCSVFKPEACTANYLHMVLMQIFTFLVGGGLGNTLLWHVIAICPSAAGASWQPFERYRLSEGGRYRRPWNDTASFAGFWVSPCVQNQTELVMRWYRRRTIPVDLPVLHWRCSDVPFERHPDYELPSLGVAPLIRELVLARGHNQLLVVTSQKYKHRSESKHCKALLEVYLEAIGLPYTYNRPRSRGSDLVLLRDAPLVVGLINSSFSFAAKLHDLDNYRVVYTNAGERPSTNIPWQLSVPTLPHELFGNYSDIDAASTSQAVPIDKRNGVAGFFGMRILHNMCPLWRCQRITAWRLRRAGISFLARSRDGKNAFACGSTEDLNGGMSDRYAGNASRRARRNLLLLKACKTEATVQIRAADGTCSFAPEGGGLMGDSNEPEHFMENYYSATKKWNIQRYGDVSKWLVYRIIPIKRAGYLEARDSGKKDTEALAVCMEEYKYKMNTAKEETVPCLSRNTDNRALYKVWRRICAGNTGWTRMGHFWFVNGVPFAIRRLNFAANVYAAVISGMESYCLGPQDHRRIEHMVKDYAVPDVIDSEGNFMDTAY